MSDVSRTTINIPVDLKKELKKVAIDEDITLSGLILKMINEGMESRNNSVNKDVSDEDAL